MWLATRVSDITIEQIAVWLVVSMFAAIIVFGVAKMYIDSKNDRQPIRTSYAEIIDLPHVANALYIWIIFQTESQGRVRLMVEANNEFVLGDHGYLKWQGNRMIQFEVGKTQKECEEAERKIQVFKEKPDVNEWRCKRCGCINSGSADVCESCAGNKI